MGRGEGLGEGWKLHFGHDFCTRTGEASLMPKVFHIVAKKGQNTVLAFDDPLSYLGVGESVRCDSGGDCGHFFGPFSGS